MIRIILFLFSSLFVSSLFANEPLEKFSYCSNGTCSIITTDNFFYMRGMPRDLNFSCKKNNQYALTFDDGPSENYPKLLDLLKKHNVKATFFVVGGNLRSDRAHELYGQIVKSGHFIANHTFSHADLTSLSAEGIYEEIDKSRQALLTSPALANISEDMVKKLDTSTKYVRPPFGNINILIDDVFKKNGYTSVRWNSDKYDWALPPTPETTQTIIERVVQHLNFIETMRAKKVEFNESILDLNHDFQNSTLQALDQYIPMIKAHGYTFVTMDECLEGH